MFEKAKILLYWARFGGPHLLTLRWQLHKEAAIREMTVFAFGNNLSPTNLLREHLISSQFFFLNNAFQIGFTPLPPPSIRKAYRTFSDNNRCRPSSRPRLSTTKLLRASLSSFISREASAEYIISTSSSFSPFPVPLHASSVLRLASARGRPALQATSWWAMPDLALAPGRFAKVGQARLRSISAASWSTAIPVFKQ